MPDASAPDGTLISTDEALFRPRVPPDLTVRWGREEGQVGDLRLPEGGGPHPVAVVLHGGCWRSVADRHYLGPLVRELNRLGWATWNAEYRPVDLPGGAWPGLLQDVAAAADHLRVLATRWKGSGGARRGARADLDLTRVVTVGHSAGGHLALWLAARRRLASGRGGEEAFPGAATDPLPVSAVVSLAGIADLEHFAGLPESERGCVGAVEELLGGRPEEVPDRLAVASPAHHLPLGVPQLVVGGRDDPDVPAAHLEAWARTARDAGDEVELAILEGVGHFEPVAPWWERWEEVRALLADFLDRRVPGASPG